MKPSASPSEPIRVEIQVWMARRRVNQSELAEILGVQPSWVNKRLHGSVNLTIDDLLGIAGALDVPVSAFFDGPPARTELRPTRYSGIPTGTEVPDTARRSRVAA